MPDAILEARDLISTISLPEDNFRNLKYAGKLKERRIGSREVTWLTLDEDFGLAPVVSSGQTSPVVGQGGYRQYKSAPIDIRFAKKFTDDELRNLVSPDKNYRIDAKFHIAREVQDMMRRAIHTQEYIAHSAIARGSVQYVSNDPQHKININLTFPIKTKTLTGNALWSDATNSTPVDDVNSWIDEMELAGVNPQIMRMSKKVWNNLKATNQFKAQFTSYLRSTGLDVGDIPPGLLTPEMVAKALGWPTIEIYNERTGVKFTASSAVTAGSSVTIPLVGETGYADTFGLNVGDKILIGYDNGSWTDEATITTVNHGASIVVDSIANNIAVGDVIVSKPTFHPENRVVLIADEQDNEYLLAPYGILTDGGVRPAMWYGLNAHVFSSGEPNLVVYRRVWNSLGLRIADPRKILSAQVL